MLTSFVPQPGQQDRMLVIEGTGIEATLIAPRSRSRAGIAQRTRVS